MVGTRVGIWRLGERVGDGPLGEVFRAESSAEPGRAAAVKLLAAGGARSPAFLKRFPAEMLALQRLDHPNVARFYDSGVTGGVPFYASEWVEGPNLRERLEAGPLPWATAGLKLAAELLLALKHGHRHGLLHRDLHPGNVRFAADGRAVLTDFGVGRVLAAPPASLPADPWGAIGYLAPEQLRGDVPTRRSDLYALGTVLYAALTGAPPFKGETATDFVRQQGYVLPPPPATRVPGLPAEFDELVCALLAKDPSRRPASAHDALEFLREVRGRLERRGVASSWPEEPSEAEEDFDVGEPGGIDEPAHFFQRTWVVATLFGLGVAAMGIGVMWPRPDAAALWSAAQPLLKSDDPADWERAESDYLSRIGGDFGDEVRQARERLAARRELRNALRAGVRAHAESAGEQCYRRGLALARVGERGEARRAWEEAAAGDSRWAELAREGLRELSKP